MKLGCCLLLWLSLAVQISRFLFFNIYLHSGILQEPSMIAFCVVIRQEHKMKLDCVVYFFYCVFPNSILKIGFIEKTCIFMLLIWILINFLIYPT